MKAAAILSLVVLTATASATGYVPPEIAFGVDLAVVAPGHYVLEANVQPGFALYQDKIKVQADGAVVRAMRMPQGTLIDDPDLGQERVLEGFVSIPLDIAVQPGSPAPALVVKYMGCKRDEMCYPPQTVRFPLQPATTAR